jgi:uncharacterized integral membrane protein (TIGR00698 family)
MTVTDVTHRGIPADEAWHDGWRIVVALVAMMGVLVFQWAPPTALLLGIVLALAGMVDVSGWGKVASKYLIQACVVILGLSMDLREVLHAGATGLGVAAATIVMVFVAGAMLAKVFQTDKTITTLISSGTAICGGSAIAAVSSVIGPTTAQTSVALATVFLLNAAALYIFPPLGHAAGLTAEQFGAWAAIAIHDVSSVVGAASTFDPASLHPATTIKLARALWIAPLTLILAWTWAKRGQDGTGKKPSIGSILPIFIVLFLVASAAGTFVKEIGAQAGAAKDVAKTGMSCALFIIGGGLSASAIAKVGWRPLALGATLWVLISAVALGAAKVLY